ncbi:MarR family winged helix-turn-helix transcriptional regulator [Paenibacillus aurantius]|uniref:MarR family winged helix-turn-helix transcriptional regulator n=1 Tax=Paenibacillus aurantius TaxID=2918900 RepID=A0AA96LAL6_9BACL|nr:MarR family winged helix-turn-helix transcriptional regulator [Paenibacillus aurantius]WNQ08855.1 MarR family winged helix-turn-helix transcriptional regulator [Paenibacillus aurantius]
MKQLPPYVNVREVLQVLVRRFGLLQKDGAQCCGVTVLQSHVLYELLKRPNQSLNDLGHILCVDTSTLSRQVHQLVEWTFISRIPDPKDRRYVVLSLTPEGEAQAHSIAQSMEDYIQEIFKNIPSDKKDQVLESLHLLSTAMSKSPNCCTPPL